MSNNHFDQESFKKAKKKTTRCINCAWFLVSCFANIENLTTADDILDVENWVCDNFYRLKK